MFFVSLRLGTRSATRAYTRGSTGDLTLSYLMYLWYVSSEAINLVVIVVVVDVSRRRGGPMGVPPLLVPEEVSPPRVTYCWKISWK